MAFRPHLGGEVGPFFIDILFAIVEEVERFYGESERRAEAFFIEPFHKRLLQPREAFPNGLGTVREDKITEHAVKIRVVIVGAVPEDGLETARGGRLVEGIDDLLKDVGDDLVDGAMAVGVIDDFISVQIVVIAVFLADEVVEVEPYFRSRNGSKKLRRNGEYEIYKVTGKRRKMCRRFCAATNFFHAVKKKRIHCHAYAIREEKSGFIVAVNFMRVQLANVFVGEVFAKHIADHLLHGETVDLDVVFFMNLARHGCDVFLFYVGIGIYFAAGRCVGRLFVFFDKVEIFLVCRFIFHLSMSSNCTMAQS